MKQVYFAVIICVTLLLAIMPVCQAQEYLLRDGFNVTTPWTPGTPPTGGYYPYGTNGSWVANNWTPWLELNNPQFKPSDFEKIEGNSSQQIWSDYSSFKAGIYRRVSGAVVGQAYQAIAWFLSIYRHGDLTEKTPGNIGQKIGIDPYGGTDWNSSNIIWCNEDFRDRTWRELSVATIARSSTITVFMRANNLYAAHNCLSFFEDVRLESAPPVISMTNLQAGLVRYNKILVTWDTDVPSTSVVDYGTTPSYGSVESDSSLVTSHSILLPPLSGGTIYHLRASSTADGYSAALSSDLSVTTLAGTLVNSIAEAKTHADIESFRAVIRNAVVTLGSDQTGIGGALYIEDADRSSGIRLYPSGPVTARTGDTVDVSGVVGSTNRERTLYYASSAVYETPHGPLRPVMMSTAALGGARLNAASDGVTDGLGTNNLSLLVTLCGKITDVDTAGKTFYVDDGVGYASGLRPAPGVPVKYSQIIGTVDPQIGQTVAVTGMSSIRYYNGAFIRQLLLRSPEDLRVF